MSFLIPQLLWALPVAALPLLIHLLSRANTPTVEFSALRFLKAMEHDTIRRLRWHQWLVIILRTLMILLLVLLLARPVLEGYYQGLTGQGASTLSVLVVDDSFSMSGQGADRVAGRRSRYTEHLLPLFEVLSNPGSQSRVVIIRSSDARRIYDGPGSSLPAARVLAPLLQPRYEPDRLEAVFDSLGAAGILEQGRLYANRELIIISDFQTHQQEALRLWANDTTGWDQWQMFLLPVAPQNRNGALSGASVTTAIPIVGELMDVQVALTNTGTSELEDFPIQLLLNGVRAGQLVVDLAPGEETQVTFQVAPTRPGHQEGYAEIEPDERSGDNRYYFHTTIPTRLRVLLLDPTDAYPAFTRLALEALASASPQIEYRRLPYSEVTWRPEDHDVVILDGPRTVPRLLPRRLRDFLEIGGKLIMLPGSAEAAATAFRELGQLLSLPEITGTGETLGAGLPLDQAAARRSFLGTALSREINRDDGPLVKAIYPLRPGGRDEVVLRLSNRRPVLVRSPVQSGQAFIFTVPMDLAWSDIPLKGSFLPMWHQLISWRPTGGVLADIRIGAEPELPLTPRQATQPVNLQGPASISSRLIPDLQRRSVILRDLQEPGLYSARFGSGGAGNAEIEERFPVNIAARELAAGYLTSAQLQNVTGSGRAFIYDTGQPLGPWVTQARFGRELWRLLLYLLLVVTVAELIIANVYRSPRRPA